TGRRITALEAQEMGIVSRVVARRALEAATVELTTELCASSPVGVREAKRAIDRAFDVSLAEGVELEDLAWRRAGSSQDRREGVESSALVPTRRGAEDAVATGGFGLLQGFLAASDGYNRHNVGKSVKESVEDVRAVAEVARGAGLPMECSISSAFGDAYAGDV